MKIDLLSAIIVLEHYHALYYRIRLILYYLKKKSNISLFFFNITSWDVPRFQVLVRRIYVLHSTSTLFRRRMNIEWKKKKLDSTNTRPASHLPILSMIMCIKYLRNQNITYIYNKYVIREEFSFSSISFALSPNSQKGKKRRKKKKKKKYEQKWSCRALYSLICREMYSPLRCCSGYLDYTLHAVLLLKLWYRAIRENIAVYWG